MKNKLIFLTDILTTILLFIQAQSTVILIVERFPSLRNYSWNTYFYLYIVYGISDAILSSAYNNIYMWIVFIVFCFNLYAITIKTSDFRRKEIIKGIYTVFIIFNMIFVVLKTVEFCIHAVIKMHA